MKVILGAIKKKRNMVKARDVQFRLVKFLQKREKDEIKMFL